MISKNTKVCSTCKKALFTDQFHNRKSSKDGLHFRCKKCELHTRKDKIEKWREDNSELIRTKSRIRYAKNKELNFIQKKEYYNKNKKVNNILTIEEIRNNTTEKKCYKCNEVKSSEEFNTDRCRKDGLAHICRSCKSKNSKNYNRKKKSEYVNKRLREDICFKLQLGLRNRLRMAVRKGWKSGSAVRDLGCSISFLKSHLESKFQSGMNWSNWGSGSGK